MKEKLNKTEISWILYDVGNSAFTMLVATTIPIFFQSLASGAGITEARTSEIGRASCRERVLLIV